jgi:hypothetical protein
MSSVLVSLLSLLSLDQLQLLLDKGLNRAYAVQVLVVRSVGEVGGGERSRCCWMVAVVSVERRRFGGRVVGVVVSKLSYR